MASREDYKLPKESIEGSNDSTSNSGSSGDYLTASGCSTEYFTASGSSEDKDTRGFAKSGPAVLEPSKDKSRHSNGRSKNLLRTILLSSWPQPSTRQVSIGSSSESNGHENQQQGSGEYRGNNEQEISTSSSSESQNREDEPLLGEHRSRNRRQTDEPRTNCCVAVMNCYNNCARKVRNSWFIRIFQFFTSIVCVSAITMGIIFFRSCEGKYPSTDPLLTILLGVFGLFLIYMWAIQVCRQGRGERFWNFERNRLIIFLMTALFFMTLEFMFFTQMSPKALQSKKEVKCAKTFYDYLYYMHIVNAGSLVLASLLYLPDCCIYVYTYKHLVPSHHNGHFQPL